RSLASTLRARRRRKSSGQGRTLTSSTPGPSMLTPPSWSPSTAAEGTGREAGPSGAARHAAAGEHRAATPPPEALPPCYFGTLRPPPRRVKDHSVSDPI